ATGQLTAAEALTQLLSGTGLTFQYLDEKTVTIVPAQTTQREPAVTNPPATSPPTTSRHSAESEELHELEIKGIPEILLQGSKILNTDIPRSREDAQPYVISGRETVDQPGASTLDEFLKQRLPMNTQGKANAQQPTSTVRTTSQINLRGLGANQTLILIDGHRAPQLNLF